MATMHSTQGSKTVTIVIQRHLGDPGSVTFKVTPEAAEVIGILEGLNEPQRKEARRVMYAVLNGKFPYTIAEWTGFTPEQRSKAATALPEIAA